MQALSDQNPIEASPRESKPLGKPWVFVCAAFTLYAVMTCVAIEILNVRAGGVLPRSEPGKWRVSYLVSERTWREFESRRADDETLATRQLTAAEHAEMLRETRKNSANATLRDTVRTFGLLQYIVIPAVVFLSMAMLTWTSERRQRSIGAVCLLAAIIVGAATLYRGYFTGIID